VRGGLERVARVTDPRSALICGAQERFARCGGAAFHVWAFNLKASGACLMKCRQTLCRIERSRAIGSFHAAKSRRLCWAHGYCGTCSDYTGKEARDLRFSSVERQAYLEAPGSEHRVVSFNMNTPGRA